MSYKETNEHKHYMVPGRQLPVTGGGWGDTERKLFHARRTFYFKMK